MFLDFTSAFFLVFVFVSFEFFLVNPKGFLRTKFNASLLSSSSSTKNYRNNYFNINLNIHQTNFIKLFI